MPPRHKPCGDINASVALPLMDLHRQNRSAPCAPAAAAGLVTLLSTLLLLIGGGAPVLAESVTDRNTAPSHDSSGAQPFKKIKSFFKGGTTTETDHADTAALPEYHGPKARIIVARVSDKTRQGWYNNSLGRAMSDQLSTALFNSNRFMVMEREAFDAIIEEQNLRHTGLAEAGTTPAMGRIQGADLGVIAAITAAEGIGGAAAGAGGGGGGLIGGLIGAVDRSYLAMELRIVDLESSQIIASTTVEGTSTDVNVLAAAGAFIGGGALGGALASWNNTPQGQALRVVIAEAVRAIAEKTPQRYFKYGGGGGSPSRPVNKKVHNVQAKLNALGFDAGPTDGIMGPSTRGAITAFQSSQGLKETGSLNLETIQALQSRAETVAEESDEIRNVQKLLGTLGYYSGKRNGVLNQKTRDALTSFQSENDLEATGRLDVATLKTLDEVSEALQGLSGGD